MIPWVWGMAMAAVSIGELLPGGSAPLRWIAATRLNDKTEHFAAYLLLALIPILGFELRKGVLAALSMILLGVALEFMQRVIPGRNFEVADMLANALGVMCGITLGFGSARVWRLVHRAATALPAWP
jgi:VanZ family protein